MSDKVKKEGSFTEKYKELWKFIKFTFAGASSSLVELGVHMLLLNVVFKGLTKVPITNPTLNMIGVTSKGYLFAFIISTTIGYAIAFIMNRKITFKADSNVALSTTLYVIMVVFTIFANGWIGSAMTTFAANKGLEGNLCDLIIKVIGMTIPTLWTYPLNRFVIHRHKKPEAGEAADGEAIAEIENVADNKAE